MAEKPKKKEVVKSDKGIPENYQPTTEEAAALKAFLRRKENSKPSSSLKLEKGKGNQTKASFKHEDEGLATVLFMESIATADFDFLNGLLNQVVNVTTQNKVINDSEANFLLSMVKGIEPRDQLETMLAPDGGNPYRHDEICQWS
ncbi:MAG: hypothetical protein IPN42_18345 [Methylococcaceae bacterium]|nr:hypothetical protein [Methylococcaceae bacterium]